MASQTLADDFINDYNGDIFVAEGGLSELGFVSAKGNGTIPKTLVGAPNNLALAGPTAAVWARGEEGRSLIVSTNGGLLGYLSGNHTIGGRINLIHV